MTRRRFIKALAGAFAAVQLVRIPKPEVVEEEVKPERGISATLQIQTGDGKWYPVFYAPSDVVQAHGGTIGTAMLAAAHKDWKQARVVYTVE